MLFLGKKCVLLHSGALFWRERFFNNVNSEPPQSPPQSPLPEPRLLTSNLFFANGSSEVRSCVKVPNSNFFENRNDMHLDSAFVGPY